MDGIVDFDHKLLLLGERNRRFFRARLPILFSIITHPVQSGSRMYNVILILSYKYHFNTHSYTTVHCIV